MFLIVLARESVLGSEIAKKRNPARMEWRMCAWLWKNVGGGKKKWDGGKEFDEDNDDDDDDDSEEEIE